ncbi:MAG: hypothetical protein NVSMB62_20650 [Acidobacteriaceae bacterium]
MPVLPLTRRWVLPLAVSTVTAFCVFILPFAFPPSHPAYGQSYVVGFNNRIAILCVALIGLAVLSIGLMGEVKARRADVTGESKLPLRYLGAIAGVVIVWIGSLAAILLRSGAHTIEDGYFIPQMEKVLLAHRAIYSQVEFVYGPLLLYPTVWLVRLTGASPSSITISYYVTVLVHHLLGLAMLFVILNRLPLGRIQRRTMFFAVSLFCLNPWMGLNYTLLRFLAPYFFLILLDGCERALTATLLSLVTGAIAVYISPEIGIAYTLGVIAYGIWRGTSRSKMFYLLPAGCVIGVAAAIRMAPANMLSGMSHYSGGFHHVVLLPSLYIFLTLTAIVWIVPRLTAGAAKGNTRYSSLLIGMYISSMTMIPAIFGAEESMHVMSNGVGFILLSGVYVSDRPSLRKLWMPAVVATYGFFLVQSFAMAKHQLTAAVVCADTKSQVANKTGKISARLEAELLKLHRINCLPPVQLSDWQTFIQSDAFAVLYPSYNYNIDSLIVSPQNRPLYFVAEADMYDTSADELMVKELRQVRWAFIGTDIGPHPVGPESENPLDLQPTFRQRHAIARNVVVAQEISQHWSRVAQVLPTLGLYKRTD